MDTNFFKDFKSRVIPRAIISLKEINNNYNYLAATKTPELNLKFYNYSCFLKILFRYVQINSYKKKLNSHQSHFSRRHHYTVKAEKSMVVAGTLNKKTSKIILPHQNILEITHYTYARQCHRKTSNHQNRSSTGK